MSRFIGIYARLQLPNKRTILKTQHEKMKGGNRMTMELERIEEGREGLSPRGINRDAEALAIFRWLDGQVHNKKAITACLLVLQGSAYSEVLLDVGQAAET